MAAIIRINEAKRTSKEDRIFTLVGYVAMIISFIAFVIIYPYTCSSDFRYITICLIYTVMTIGLANKYKYKWMPVFNAALIAFLGMITVIYMLWDRW